MHYSDIIHAVSRNAFLRTPKFINFILLILTYNLAFCYHIYTFNQNVTLEHAMHAIFEGLIDLRGTLTLP